MRNELSTYLCGFVFGFQFAVDCGGVAGCDAASAQMKANFNLPPGCWPGDIDGEPDPEAELERELERADEKYDYDK